VEVQKGSVTASFRKILGVQDALKKKSRDKHSHHAIDAMMLTLMPVAAQRDKMLQLYYEIEEKRMTPEVTRLQQELKRECSKCGIKGNVAAVVNEIESNILIRNQHKDQTLTPASRRWRVRGKVIPKKGEEGKISYERDDSGKYKRDKFRHRIPVAQRWLKGDCIRGKLHGETFYGAITQAQKDDKGSLLRGDGHAIIREQMKDQDKIYYVVRRELRYKKSSQDSGFKDWEELETSIVDKPLKDMMMRQFPKGTSFKDACEQGVYMLDKDGNRVNKIRHVRCYTSIKNPLRVKEQTYLSSCVYKQGYYAEVGELYAMCQYQDEENEDASEFVIYNMFEVAGNSNVPQYITNKKKNNAANMILKRIVRTGDLLLLYKDGIDELQDLDREQLSKRLFIVLGFENPKLIRLKNHINAQQDKMLGKGESIKDFSNLPPKIRCSITTLNFLIEGYDFEFVKKGKTLQNISSTIIHLCQH
jgi:CRISPR-associated endonuclease Csn1